MEIQSEGATHVPAGEGKTVWLAGTDLVTFKATGPTTNGAFALFDSLIVPCGVPPPTSTAARTRRGTSWRGNLSSWMVDAESRSAPARTSTRPRGPSTRARTWERRRGDSSRSSSPPASKGFSRS